MRKSSNLDQKTFEELLFWLDPDREAAGVKYEQIRSRLVKMFYIRGRFDAEELADETINKVAGRVSHISETYTGDPVPYFYAVANNVWLDYLKADRKKIEVRDHMVPVNEEDDADERYACLKKCLEHLSEENKKLILDYYSEAQGREKIERRKKIIESVGISAGAMHVKISRMRHMLASCIANCVKKLQ